MGSCLSGDRNKRTIPYSELASTSRDDGVIRRRNSKRKITRKGSSPSNDSSREMSLHRVPGRMFLNGTTDHASLFTRQGKKGVNQDAMIVWENFGSKEDTIFCGVFDGHGPFGHMVAKKVRDSLPLKLNAQWELDATRKEGQNDIRCQVSPPMLVNKDSGTSHCDPGHQGSYSDIYIMLKESFLKAFKVMDKELKLHPYIDCYTSGTTSVALVKQGRDLIIGNVGDSRAVLGTRDESNSLIAVQLTVDLKPNLPREAERIRLRWLKAPAYLISSLGSFRRSSVDLPVSKMNHFIVQQNTFISCEETRGFASISDLKDPVVCPKPRRLAILANNHIKQPLRWHQAEVCDSKAGADLLDIILKKGSEQSSAHVASSPPFFSGSPPSRASNPLIQDARFGDEKLSPMPALPPYSPSGLSSPSSASSAHKGGGCARMKFGLKPAAVRVEGFDCLSRDRQNSRIPAVA